MTGGLKSLALGAVMALGLTASAHADQASDCNRDCLGDLVRQYVEALVSRDASGLPVAKDIRFTENLAPLKFGTEGLWATAIGKRDYDLFVMDPAKGSVTWFGIIIENETPVMIALRLQVKGKMITEAETVVGRIGLNNAGKVEAPRTGLMTVVPEGQRSSREELIAAASANWDAMAQGDGSLAPYADVCVRFDNGHKMTSGEAREGDPEGGNISNLGCRGQMNSGRFVNGHVTEPRRPWTVDVERGLVVGLYTPNIPGNVKNIKLRNGKTVTVGPDELIPFTIVQTEMFKVVDGKIEMVEVVLGPRVPFGMRSPFDMKDKWERR
jgi:hypothetical protein